ncbi:MAG: hypothetical protein HY760_08720 [Nitrospirae bacterium]|nr:hypothetical protein [Nitrospirota bacterium]
MLFRILIGTLWTAWTLSGCGAPSSDPQATDGGGSARTERQTAYQTVMEATPADAPAWIPAGNLPKGIYDNAATVWNGYLYVSGGFGPGPEVNTSEVYIFHILPDHQVSLHAVSHIPRKTLRFPKGERAVVTGIDGHRMFAANGRVYLVGGKFQYIRTDCYPPTENPCFTPTPTAWNLAILHAPVQADGTLGEWAETPLPDGVGAYTPAVVFHEGGVYIIGGWDGEKNVDTVVSAPLLPDGEIGPWQTSPPLPEGLSKHAAAAKRRREVESSLKGSHGPSFPSGPMEAARTVRYIV